VEPPILFFDGVCGLCNGFVDFLMARDRRGAFRFATLQGETAARLLAGTGGGSSEGPGERMRSVVLWQDGRAYRRSEAVIRLFTGLGGIWKLAAAGRLLPAGFRDLLYDFIARNRYRWFGKRETCRMPKPEERARFLP
jgi:predicted DCC family thiol-disulfide oxidoreductase YuxK